MTTATDFLEIAILDHVYRGIPYAAPASLFVALYTVPPGEDGTGGTEVSGGSYAREAAGTMDRVSVAGANHVQNAAVIRFPVATADWGMITHLGIADAASGGNILNVLELVDPADMVTPQPVTILAGQAFELDVGRVVIECD